MECRERRAVRETLASIRLGDKLAINDWKAKYTVVGISEHYILAHYGQSYTIIDRVPVSQNYMHNGVRDGDIRCAPDWWVFGYTGGYHFTNEDWIKEYLADLEEGNTELSARREAPVWFLSVVGHTDKFWAKKKAPEGACVVIHPTPTE